MKNPRIISRNKKSCPVSALSLQGGRYPTGLFLYGKKIVRGCIGGTCMFCQQMTCVVLCASKGAATCQFYTIIMLDITRAHSGAQTTQNKRDKTSRAGRDKSKVKKAHSTDAIMMHTYHKPTITIAALMSSLDIINPVTNVGT